MQLSRKPRYRRVSEAQFQRELRQAIYKGALLPPDCPRKGDRAAVVRDHHADITGLEVRVVNDPHWCESYCSNCGQPVKDWFVEVVPVSEHPTYPAAKGPYFMPQGWLKRILPLSVAGRRALLA